MIVGVLALQGAFREHIRMVKMCGEEAREIRLPEELDRCRRTDNTGRREHDDIQAHGGVRVPRKIKSFVKSGKPVMGTCAGLILLASRQQGRKQKLLNLIDIDVRRNAYGRQIESREVDIEIPGNRAAAFPCRIYQGSPDRKRRAGCGSACHVSGQNSPGPPEKYPDLLLPPRTDRRHPHSPAFPGDGRE